MRVGIGRFRRLRKTIEQARKTKSVKGGERKREAQRRAVRHTPGAVWTTRCLGGEVLTNSALSNLPLALLAVLPLLPDQGPQTMAYPLIQLLQQ